MRQDNYLLDLGFKLSSKFWWFENEFSFTQFKLICKRNTRLIINISILRQHNRRIILLNGKESNNLSINI